MKLLKLRIENVNSLAGVHEIDFRAPEFKESGIFAICGPTGSGKTSILDAVTLALYGTTPRMEERSQTAKKDDLCMVLTKNADQTSAQVVFESFGAVYRSRWSRRVKRTGKVAAPEVELVRLKSADDAEGTIVAEKISEWKPALERILGMNIKAFGRSAMLAQGSFAELLRANNRERADILEKITGTGIYTVIGERVFERMTEEKEKEALLGERMKSVQVLPEEAREAVLGDLQKTSHDSSALAKALDETRLDIAWTKAIGEARLREKRADAELSILAAEEAALEPERTRAEAARRAEESAKLLEVREKAASEAARHGKLAAGFEAQAREAGAQLQGLDSALKEAERLEKEADASLKSAEPDLVEMEEMDGRLQTLSLALESAQKHLKERCLKRDALQKEAAALCEAMSKAQAEKEKLLTELKARSSDEALPEEAPLIAEEAKQAENFSSRLEAQKEDLAVLERDVKKLSNARERAMSESKASEERLEVVRGALREAERRAKNALSGNALTQKIAETEELTGKLWAKEWLQETAALLGFADAMPAEALKMLESRRMRLLSGWENLAGAEEKEIRAALEGVMDWSAEAGEAQQALEAARQSEREAQSAFEKAGRKVLRAREAFGLKSAELHSKEALFQEGAKAHEEELIRLEGRFKRYMPQDWRMTEPARHARELLERANRFKKAQDAHRNAEIALAKASAEAQAAQKGVAQAKEEEAEAVRNCDAAGEALRSERAKRSEKFGERDPKKEREALGKTLAERISAVRKAEALCQEAAKRLQTASLRKEAEEKAGAEYASASSEAAEALEKALAKAGFANEADAVKAHLSREETESLEVKIRAHDLKMAAARSESANARDAVEKLEAHPRREAPLDVLLAEEKSVDEKMKMLLELKGSLEARLRADDEARAKAADAREALEKSAKAVLLWTRLNALIGSKDGARFRQAAQKLTFELLLHEANEILRQMQSRYELLAQGENGLDLAVRDLELAGIERTSFNLSGGETFMVSLALALSLSRISTNRMRVDTLFLDEGFGSLDPVSLSKALNALEMLQQTSGKLIGVISHVPAVRERVGVQIVVKPRGSSGQSDISGPGVRKFERG